MKDDSWPSRGRYAVLSGIGAYVPPRVVTNDELCARLDTSDEWIRSRTGIRSRHVIEPGTTMCDLAVHAGSRALESAGGGAVDALLLATMTPDRMFPATAPEVATRLGFTGIGAADVGAACSGFPYGLAIAAGFLATGMAKRVLLIGAEAVSTVLNPEDRTTAAIMADGAGAVVLRAGEAAEPGAFGPVDLGSDGTNIDLIQIPGGGTRERISGRAWPAEDRYFQMDGRKVYRHAVDRMVISAQTAAKAAGWAMTDIDRVVVHQANARISAAVTDRLGFDPGKMLSNIEHVGNTAAASIPLLLAEAAADGRIKAGHRVLLAAFGGGLTWGATTLIWPDIPLSGEIKADPSKG